MTIPDTLRRKMGCWAPCPCQPAAINVLTLSTYKGIKAIGVVIGIRKRYHHIFLRCNSCLSVPSVLNTSNTLSPSIAFPGNATGIGSLFPCTSSIWRRALSGGMLFNAHSSYGIRCRMEWPQTTNLFCHPLSARSHFDHVPAALAVILSMTPFRLSCGGRQ